MSNEEFPGFIEDEPKKPSKPAPAAPAKAFNAFADVPAQAAAPAAPVAKPAAKPPAPAAKPAPAAASADPAKGFNAFADAALTPDGNDADVKPGTGKDLWACPHCGTKSKPERTTCRACGKSPSEPVIILWHEKPMVKPAIAAGGVLVVVLLAWLLLGGGVRLVEAQISSIDSKPRTGGGAGAAGDYDGQAFTPSKRYGVCGRVVGSQSKGNLTMLVLALGADGKDEARVNESSVDFTGNEPVTTPELHIVTVLCFGSLPAAGKGQIVSLLGDVGTLAGNEDPVVRVERAVTLP